MFTLGVPGRRRKPHVQKPHGQKPHGQKPQDTKDPGLVRLASVSWGYWLFGFCPWGFCPWGFCPAFSCNMEAMRLILTWLCSLLSIIVKILFLGIWFNWGLFIYDIIVESHYIWYIYVTCFVTKIQVTLKKWFPFFFIAMNKTSFLKISYFTAASSK